MSDIHARIQQRESVTAHPLETVPKNVAHKPHGTIPNTPLTISIISFLLGSSFSLAFVLFLSGGMSYWWSTYQLGFFIAAWSAFHWAEFAVTAGWNFDKCSVDCTSIFHTF
jgi:protein-S-isoprenylcysteine O-methyltransferase